MPFGLVIEECLTDIVIYKVLKRRSDRCTIFCSLTDIVIYKVLKRNDYALAPKVGLTDIVIYKVLKLAVLPEPERH